MSEFSQFEPTDNTAARYEFGSRTTHDERLAVELFDASGVAWWTQVRTEKFSEHVDPKIMYITPDLSHRVVWLKHAGMVENELEQIVPYTKYHVICDCAAEAEHEAHPASSMHCDVIDQILIQRAAELANENRLPETLGALSEFNEDAMDYQLTFVGQELAIKALERLLDMDIRHPEYWAANRINRMHEIDPLSAFIGGSSRQLMPLLDLMEQAQLIEVNGDKVLVPLSQIVD